MAFYSCGDACIQYFGVWQAAKDEMVSYWNRAFAKVGFTGDTVTVKASAGGDIRFWVDEELHLCCVPQGEVTLSVPPGEHVLMLEDPESSLRLSGICLPEGERLFRPRRRPYIHFVGDSITAEDPGYSFAAGAALDADYSVQASSGIALRDGWGWRAWSGDPASRVGMRSAFFQLGQPSETEAAPPREGAPGEVPDAMVIFLGTNDYLNSPEDFAAGNVETFAAVYLDFIGAVRRLYPHARIYMLQALSDPYCRRDGIATAFAAVSAAYEDVHLIRSDLWGVELCADGTHPSEAGYRTMAERICAYLQEDFLGKGVDVN